MNTMTAMETPTAIETWLARLGLAVTAVDRCPVAGCDLCSPSPVVAAA